MALPKTKARLQQSITIYAIPGGLDQRDATSIAASLVGTKKIGAIKSMKLEQARTINVWRELDCEKTNPGEIMETYPSLPTYTLTIEKTVLYKENLLQAFGLTEGLDLLEQTKPMLIEIRLMSPDEATIPVKTIYLLHVWFENNPLEFNVEETDLRIVQQIKATVGRIVTA